MGSNKVVQGVNDLATVNPTLAAQWNHVRNGDLTPDMVAAGSSKKAWWKCKEGHEWEDTIPHRIRGDGCPFCSNRRLLRGYNDLRTVNPTLAAEWHPVRNGDLTPEMVTERSGKMAWWQCQHGHEWEAKIADRAKGKGCPACSGHKVVPGLNDLATINPELASDWHPTKNGDLKPWMVTVHSNKNVWWKCKEGHEWDAIINSRTSGRKCPFCSGRRILVGCNDLATTHPDLATQWHPTLNGDLTAEMVTPHSHQKVWWLGPCGHEWDAAIHSRVAGNNCPVCSGYKIIPGINDLATVNPALAAEWHPFRNGDLTPQTVSYGSAKKAWWKCQFGHEWEAAINSRSRGVGCPECSKGKHTSFQEKAVLFYTMKVFPDALDSQKTDWSGGFSFDIYIPSISTVVEYDGWRWHQDIEKDLRKNCLCKENGINIIRIREPGCPEIQGETIILKDFSLSSLEDAIRCLLRDFLKCTPLPEINIDKDRIQVYQLADTSQKETSLASVAPDIAAEWHPTKNGSITPWMVGPGTRKKVWWKGRECGHEWESIIANRVTLHYKCPICSGQQVLAGFNDLVTTHPEIAKEWHPTKNAPLTPQQISHGSGKKKIWWQCEKGHEWEMTVFHRTEGCSCPYCSERKVWPGFNDLATKRPDLVEEWDYTKNGPLTPQTVIYKSNKKVWWKCKNGHSWQTRISKRTMRGYGCAYCSGRKVTVGQNDLVTTHPKLTAEWHPTKNGDLTPNMVSAGSNRKAWWVCEKGHEWEAVINSRSTGNGCPYCSNLKAWPGFNDLATTHPEIAKEWHPTLNGDLTPEMVVAGSEKRVWWHGDCGHDWQTTCYSRKVGSSCPICAKKILKGKRRVFDETTKRFSFV